MKFEKKKLHSSIPVHKWNKNDVYTFNLNPSEQYDELHRGIYKYPERYNNILGLLVKYLDKYKCFDYYLCMETQNGRLHFHGYIQIHDIIDFDMNVLPMLKPSYGYEIDTIQDSAEWYTYVHKQQHLWDSKYDVTGLRKVVSKIRRGFKDYFPI